MGSVTCGTSARENRHFGHIDGNVIRWRWSGPGPGDGGVVVAGMWRIGYRTRTYTLVLNPAIGTGAAEADTHAQQEEDDGCGNQSSHKGDQGDAGLHCS